ncbi:hypothetical protein AB0E59_39770 [Lentzea sp. NPDC034063]|uniref:hypothetical protein n=1 Tax=unclassified Lentzea TaxID=2643253 RepID=UPI0033D370F3
MNSSVKLALVVAVAVSGIAACTSTPAPKQNSAPATESTSVTSPAVVTEVVTATVTNPPQAVVKVDNRLGYGTVKLGMTLEELNAVGPTQLSWNIPGDGVCVSDGKVAISKKYGVVRITLPADAKTSRGIGVGSTFAEVKNAYQGASEWRAGWSAPIDDSASYAFIGSSQSDHFADSDKVTLVQMYALGNDCAMAHL